MTSRTQGSDPAPPEPRLGARLTIYLAALVTITAVSAGFAVSEGESKRAQPDIRGGYDVSAGARCLGGKVDIRQSGEYVRLDNPLGSIGGSLSFRNGRLSGTVHCVNGATEPIDATVMGPAVKGWLGSGAVRADFKRDPDPNVQRPRIPGSLDGEYRVSPRSTCLGGTIKLAGRRNVELIVKGRRLGRLHYDGAQALLTGGVTCLRGPKTAWLTGAAANREVALRLKPPRRRPEEVTATKQRQPESLFAAFFIAVAVVMLVARLTGTIFIKLGQPRVMGEVVAGILLGPTLLGKVAPAAENALFPVDVIPYIGVAASLGLIFYMFLVGLEIDLTQLRGRVAQAVAISNTGVLVPMAAGLLVAVPIYSKLAPDKDFLPFALFMGVAMSITAFPVLARILSERRMLKRPIGALTLASAAIDDVTAWFLIALATTVATAGSGGRVVRTIVLALAFTAVMVLITRRILARASVAFDEAGRVPGVWVAAIFAGVLLSAWATSEIGIAVIFGAFIMGAVMPRHAGLTEDVTRRVEDFVVLLLLPLFFANTGLKTDVLLLDRPGLIVITVILLLVAVACKFGGTMLASRVTGLGWRDSAVVGTLMNTRGLTELIVLNLALEQGAISEALFAALVVMALVTTFATGPALRLLDPRNEYGSPLEEDLERARRESETESPIPTPDRAILVTPQTDAAVAQLLAIGEPLAMSEPRRELILTRVLHPPRTAAVRGGLQTEQRLVTDAADVLARKRLELQARGVAARSVAFTSATAGQDLVRLAEREEVDLILIDGRRPLLGGGVPRGDVGTVLAKAICDVAVLVARDDAAIDLGEPTPVVVPFGGAQHDWAALELGAWLALASAAPLRLLGAAGQTADGKDASRLLANAALLVRQFVGVAAESVVASAGGDGILDAASGAGLLIVGLSDRWRREGLGATRSAIANAGIAPILFVRRGLRPGVLAPATDVTRFTWSSAVVGGGERDLSSQS